MQLEYRVSNPGVIAPKSVANRDDLLGRVLRMMLDPSQQIPPDVYKLIEQPSREHFGGATANCFVLPWSALARDLTTSTGAPLGAGVAASPVQQSLRGFSVTASLCSFIECGGAVSRRLPVVTGTPVAEFVAEQGVPTTPDASFGAATLAAKTIAATVTVSRRLTEQTGAAVESLMRAELLKAIGRTLDAALINGDGNLQLLGILQTANVGTQGGTSLDRVGVVAMLNNLTAQGVARERISFVTDPATAAVLQNRSAPPGSGQYVLGDDDRMVGRPVYVTPETPAGTVIAGDFSGAFIGTWGGLEMSINPYKHALNGAREIHVRMTVGLVVPRPATFIISTSVT